MAILARNSITVAWQTDITSVTWYYKLQSSTAAPPAKPTAATPSGWSTTEPTYTEGSTNSLYVCQKTTFSDGSFAYSDVSLSSSYEAAKTAYNKAYQAYEAATPIETRTYTGLIGSENNAANASFYFAKIHPTSYAINWKVKFKIVVKAPEAYAETIDIQFGGYGSTFSSYDSYTTRTGSVALYYINLYRATSAGIITNHKGHAVGFGLRASTNPTNASYARTIYVELLEVENCTVAFMDTAVKYADIDGTGSTNYYQLTEMGVSTTGQNATNNANTHYTQFASAVKAGSFGVKRYTLLMKDADGQWVSFINQANTTAATKTVSEAGHMLGKLLYSAGGAEYASGANTSTIYDAYPFDFRYSTNCASTLTAYKPVYLVGEVRDDDLFYLDTETWWTQDIPTGEDGKTYIYVGQAYSAYQVWLSTENPAYQFYNGEFLEYEKIKTMKAQTTADNAEETGSQNTEQLRRLAEQNSQIQQLIDQIQLWVSSIANKSAWTNGQDISAYETDVPPTLDNYPAAEEFWIWPICNTNIYCSDTLICGTNNYAAHLHDIAACRNENKYYIFDQDTTQTYYWRELTESEYRSLSNMYSAINIEAEGIEIRSVLNTVETLLSLTPDGVVVTPGKLLCC